MEGHPRSHSYTQTNELPTDLWGVVVAHMDSMELWRLVGVSHASRDAVVSVVMEREALRRGQACAFIRIVHLQQSAFLTGGAGTGKSHIMRKAVDTLLSQKKSVAVTAYTGMASLVATTNRLRASTIHRAFNIQSRQRSPSSASYVFEGVAGPSHSHDDGGGGGSGEDDDDESGGPAIVDDYEEGLPTVVLNQQTTHRLCGLKLLVVDEISMVGRSMIDMIDSALRAARHSPLPWGGCQVLFCGDFFQIAPIGLTPTSWAFQAPQWETLSALQLTEVVRQTDPQWIAALNRMRRAEPSAADLALVNARTRQGGEADTCFMPSHVKCDRKNLSKLSAVATPLVGLHADVSLYEIHCRYPWCATELHLPARTPQLPKQGTLVLSLKVGARVRCLKNIMRNGALETANNQVGTVVDINSVFNEVTVLWDRVGCIEAQTTTVQRCWWLKKQSFTGPDECTVHVVVKQVPLALAWAVTLHSAQGSSVDSPVDVDHKKKIPIGGNKWAAEPGATYVGLSRATRLEHMRILEPLRMKDFRAHPAVKEYYRSLPTI